MSKQQHTPGPWFQGTGDHAYCVYDKRVWVNADGSRGGDTPNLVVVVSPKDAIADARLIAAAPELLEALMEIEAYLLGLATMSKKAAALSAIAGAVIAKATGAA